MAVSSGVYSLIGVVVGSISTGGFQFASLRRTEWREAHAARRLVLSELLEMMVVIDQTLDAAEDEADWPSDGDIERVAACPMWTQHAETLGRIRRIPWNQLQSAFGHRSELAARLARRDLKERDLQELEGASTVIGWAYYALRLSSLPLYRRVLARRHPAQTRETYISRHTR